jgi:hypothetical protein
VEREADRELLATTERDLVMSHYRRDAVSDYYLEHELNRPRPSINRCAASRRPSPMSGITYVDLRQVLLNQFDEQLQVLPLRWASPSLRYFFARSVCWRMLNANRSVVSRL